MLLESSFRKKQSTLYEILKFLDSFRTQEMFFLGDLHRDNL